MESGSGLVTDLAQLVLHQVCRVESLSLGSEDAGAEIHLAGRVAEMPGWVEDYLSLKVTTF